MVVMLHLCVGTLATIRKTTLLPTSCVSYVVIDNSYKIRCFFRWEEKLVAPLIAALYVDRTNERHKKLANAKRRSLRDHP